MGKQSLAGVEETEVSAISALFFQRHEPLYSVCTGSAHRVQSRNTSCAEPVHA